MRQTLRSIRPREVHIYLTTESQQSELEVVGRSAEGLQKLLSDFMRMMRRTIITMRMWRAKLNFFDSDINRSSAM